MFDMFGCVLYPSATVDAAALKAALVSIFSLQTTPGTTLLVHDGNSIVEGYGASALQTAQRKTLALLKAAGKSIQPFNMAVYGRTQAQVNAVAAANVVALGAAGSYTKKIVLAVDVSNDLNATALSSDAMTSLQSYCSTVRSAGFLVIVSTVKPRGDATANFIAQQPAFNTSLRASWVTFADALMDVAADAAVGGNGAGTGITIPPYYYDQAHLTTLGQQSVIAPNYEYPSILTLA
jgi:hypothetical protein